MENFTLTNLSFFLHLLQPHSPSRWKFSFQSHLIINSSRRNDNSSEKRIGNFLAALTFDNIEIYKRLHNAIIPFIAYTNHNTYSITSTELTPEHRGKKLQGIVIYRKQNQHASLHHIPAHKLAIHVP